MHYLFCYGLLWPAGHKGVFLPGAPRAAVSPVPSDTKAFSNVKSWSEPVGISEKRKLWDLIDGGRWWLSGFTFTRPLAYPFSFPCCGMPYSFHCIMKLARAEIHVMRASDFCKILAYEGVWDSLQISFDKMCLGRVCPHKQTCGGEQRNSKNRFPVRTEFLAPVRLFFWCVPFQGQLGCLASLFWRETSSTHIGPRKEIKFCRKRECESNVCGGQDK